MPPISRFVPRFVDADKYADSFSRQRLIQTRLRESAYRRPYRTSAQRTAALAPYLRFYNHRRPHASLGRRSPWMRFQEAA